MAELRIIMISNGQELLSDLPIVSIRGSKVAFVDGSHCDLATGNVNLKGTGRIVMRPADDDSESHINVRQSSGVFVKSVATEGSIHITTTAATSTEMMKRSSSKITYEPFFVRWFRKLMARFRW